MKTTSYLKNPAYLLLTLLLLGVVCFYFLDSKFDGHTYVTVTNTEATTAEDRVVIIVTGSNDSVEDWYGGRMENLKVLLWQNQSANMLSDTVGLLEGIGYQIIPNESVSDSESHYRCVIVIVSGSNGRMHAATDCNSGVTRYTPEAGVSLLSRHVVKQFIQDAKPDEIIDAILGSLEELRPKISCPKDPSGSETQT